MLVLLMARSHWYISFQCTWLYGKFEDIAVVTLSYISEHRREIFSWKLQVENVVVSSVMVSILDLLPSRVWRCWMFSDTTTHNKDFVFVSFNTIVTMVVSSTSPDVNLKSFSWVFLTQLWFIENLTTSPLAAQEEKQWCHKPNNCTANV